MQDKELVDKKAKKNELFERQKKMLIEFAKNGNITKEYCEQEIKILEEKMHPYE